MNTINRPILYICIISLGIAGILGFIRPTPRAHAAQYFGGIRTGMLACTCSGNMLIYINNYVNGGGSLALSYNGSGRLFSNGNIFGTYLLGSYSPGGICRIGIQPYCTTVRVDGSFDSSPGTGTSL